MRLLTLLARHGIERHADAIDRLDAWFDQHLPAGQRDLVVSDTSLPAGHTEPLGPGRTLIGSSNAYWEFSAWDAAITYLGRRIDDYDVVHLATSAFGALGTRHLERFDARILGLMPGRRAVLGHIDHVRQPVHICGACSQAWVRSSWVFVAPQELCRLGSLVGISTSALLFSGDPAAPFQPEAPLSQNCRDDLVGWITGDGNGLGTSWHSRFDLTAATLGYFEAKALAILNEHLLSIRLRQAGCTMVDATWLAARVSHLGPDRALERVPTWQWQVAAREVVLHKHLSRSVRAALVSGETADIARQYGTAVGRQLLWQALRRDPALATTRPLVGALRRLHGLDRRRRSC